MSTCNTQHPERPELHCGLDPDNHRLCYSIATGEHWDNPGWQRPLTKAEKKAKEAADAAAAKALKRLEARQAPTSRSAPATSRNNVNIREQALVVLAELARYGLDGATADELSIGGLLESHQMSHNHVSSRLAELREAGCIDYVKTDAGVLTRLTSRGRPAYVHAVTVTGRNTLRSAS